MKKMIAVLASVMMVAAFAQAADTENKGSETTDTSKNPITGTVTKTHKMKKKMKDAEGHQADVSVKETTKTHKDGKTEKSVKVDAESTSK